MIIKAENITVGYGSKTIIEELNFVVENPQIISIIGPNGSGKSTLLKALANLLPLSNGTIYLQGKELNKLPIKELAQTLAILPQTAMAPMDLTVENLIKFGRLPYQKFWKEDATEDGEAINQALDLTNLQEFRHRELGSLSGGERQRVWLAMALAQDPEILLLDEPTTYLDIRHQLDLMNLIYELHENKKLTIIMVLHDLNHAARFSHRLVAIKQGKILKDGLVREVFTEEVITEVYDIETQVTMIKDGEESYPICIPLRGISR